LQTTVKRAFSVKEVAKCNESDKEPVIKKNVFATPNITLIGHLLDDRTVFLRRNKEKLEAMSDPLTRQQSLELFIPECQIIFFNVQDIPVQLSLHLHSARSFYTSFYSRI
jgi:hypothetical protein